MPLGRLDLDPLLTHISKLQKLDFVKHPKILQVHNKEVSEKEAKGSSDSCSFKSIMIKNNLYHHLESVCWFIAPKVCLN